MTAPIAMLIWVPVTLALTRWLPPSLGVALGILGARLLLPVGFAFDTQGLPAIGRTEISVLSAFAGCLLFHRRRLRAASLTLGPVLLMVLVLGGTILATATNSDALRFGPRYLPALTLYDALGQITLRMSNVLIPFLLGLALLRSKADLRLVLLAFASAGLVYSLLLLWEIRMSPHLHRDLYGFAPHSFGQHVRYGGYRPMVFIGHGLLAAFFALSALLVSSVLTRARIRVGPLPAWAVAAWLACILILCKSLGSVLLALIFVPSVLCLSYRNQAKVAIVTALFVLSYPIVRVADLLPEHSLLSAVYEIDEERGASLKTRFDQERQLLDRALERPWSGWGSWGRNRVFDLDTGSDLSITDGRWIIELGVYGIPGFVGFFGLLLWPVIRASRSLSFQSERSGGFLIAGLCLLVAMYSLYLLPNSGPSDLEFFLAGGLAAQGQRARSPRPGYRSSAPSASGGAPGAQ